MFTFYEVGGKIRDVLLGLQSKDVDYVAVPSTEYIETYKTADEMFEVLVQFLVDEGFKMYLVTGSCFTVRAKFPVGHMYMGDADFVMARKEIGYIDGTRTPIVVPGTLYDDLERRDFTVNAMARDHDGSIIDPFGGQADLANKLLRTPIDPYITFADDPLRLLRAIRFSVTKDFVVDSDIQAIIHTYNYDDNMSVVSAERIREELYKALKFDSFATIKQLCAYRKLGQYVFTKTGLWLKPTMEDK